MVLELMGHEIIVQPGSHLASSPEITVESWKSSLLGGEGFVYAVQGPDDLYLHTRSPESFLSWLIPQLPSRSSN